ncbi:MAG: DUF362 domain-containing protein [Chloroflexi bacterium]|nr:DUF362 domain-containing protein [Chloroflexota bacterium]
MLSTTDVVLYDTGTVRYPAAPFHPSEAYPEYPFGADCLAAEDNPVYRAVREMLYALGLDRERYGTAAWNPFGGLVPPGGTVLIKPNLVISEHDLGQRGIEASVAHGSVLRPLIDYAYRALEGRGRIIVADSPLKEVDFDRILRLTGVQAVKAFYDAQSAAGLETLDFRDLHVVRNQAHFMTQAQRLPGDPAGYTLVDLGRESMFEEIAGLWHRYRSTAVYYENVMGEFHHPGRHVYSMPNTLLGADLVIFVAKLKTHRKGGVTLCLKNAVGTTNEKRALPHHRAGSPSRGGDAIADGARLDAWLEDNFRDLMLGSPYGRRVLEAVGGPLKALGRGVLRRALGALRPVPPEQTIVEGDWYGNDTVWRMALDLNLAFLFADRGGTLQPEPQRHYLGVVDGVVAGDGEGPLYPDPVDCGALLAGFHPVAVDIVGATLMGFDYRKVPMLREGAARPWRLRLPVAPEDITVHSNRPDWVHLLRGAASPFAFRPSAGWAGHVERE